MSILEKYNKAHEQKDEASMREILHDDFKFTMHASGNVLTKEEGRTGIFIRLENQLRMDRLKRREEERYGARLIADKAIQETSKAFLEWANQYENPHCDGRSLKTHKNWMKLLNCKTLTIDGKAALKDKIDIVLNEIESYNNNL